MASDRLELIINPDAEGKEEATRTGDDWPCLKRSLMHFHGKVEVRKGVGAERGVPFNEFAFFLFEDAMMFRGPSIEEALNSMLLGFNFSMGEVPIRVRIGEVVPEGEFDILISFDDRRS